MTEPKINPSLEQAKDTSPETGLPTFDREPCQKDPAACALTKSAAAGSGSLSGPEVKSPLISARAHTITALAESPGARQSTPDASLSEVRSSPTHEEKGGFFSSVGNFFVSCADGLGLTSIVQGIGSLAMAPYRLMAANFSAYMRLGLDLIDVMRGQKSFSDALSSFGANSVSGLKQFASDIGGGLSLLKGAAMLVGELTGITDVVMCVKYALEGNWAMAGMHLAFAALSIGSLVATVATFGAAGGSMAAVMLGKAGVKQAVQQTLKVAAKEFLETGAREIGQSVITKAGEKLSAAVLEKAGAEVAEKGAAALAQNVIKEGSRALTHEATEKAMKQAGQEVTARVLKEANVSGLVSDLTLDLLKKIDGKSASSIAAELKELGVSEAKALEMAKAVKKALSGGKADEAIKQVLEDGISKEICAHFEKHMAGSFKAQFRRKLLGEAADQESQILAAALKDQAERAGKSAAELADELVESGWKGAREGMEKSVRKAVREGIDDAFKRFRRRHGDNSLGGGDQETQQNNNLGISSRIGGITGKKEIKPDAWAKKQAEDYDPGKLEIKVEDRLVDGKLVRHHYERVAGAEKWDLVNKKTLEDRTGEQAKRKAKETV